MSMELILAVITFLMVFAAYQVGKYIGAKTGARIASQSTIYLLCVQGFVRYRVAEGRLFIIPLKQEVDDGEGSDEKKEDKEDVQS